MPFCLFLLLTRLDRCNRFQKYVRSLSKTPNSISVLLDMLSISISVLLYMLYISGAFIFLCISKSMIIKVKKSSEICLHFKKGYIIANTNIHCHKLLHKIDNFFNKCSITVGFECQKIQSNCRKSDRNDIWNRILGNTRWSERCILQNIQGTEGKTAL